MVVLHGTPLIGSLRSIHPAHPNDTGTMAADSDFSRKFSTLKTAAQRQCGLNLGSDLHSALNEIARLSDVDDAAIAGLIVDISSPTGGGFVQVWLGAGVEG